MNRYPYHQSPLFRLSTRKKLAEVLLVARAELLQAAKHPADYYIVFTPKKVRRGRKARTCQQPRKPFLYRLHRRVKVLLSRIETPPYLHSAVKGRSYITNASAHLDKADEGLATVDLRTFFPSVSEEAILRFFLHKMECAPDVARILARVLTYNGHLATGSPVSPLLSFFAHQDMFDEIYEIAARAGVSMALYVDDMSFAGAGASPALVFRVGQLARRNGLETHKERIWAGTGPKTVTGTVLDGGEIRLPNRRYLQLHNTLRALKRTNDKRQRFNDLQVAIGLLYEAAQFDPRYRSTAEQLVSEQRVLRKELGIKPKRRRRRLVDHRA